MFKIYIPHTRCVHSTLVLISFCTFVKRLSYHRVPVFSHFNTRWYEFFVHSKHLFKTKASCAGDVRPVAGKCGSRCCSIFIRLTFSSRGRGSFLIHLVNHFIFFNFNQVAPAVTTDKLTLQFSSAGWQRENVKLKKVYMWWARSLLLLLPAAVLSEAAEIILVLSFKCNGVTYYIYMYQQFFSRLIDNTNSFLLWIHIILVIKSEESAS